MGASPRPQPRRRILVLGLGAFGGGAGAARWLVRHGHEVTVTDLRSSSQLPEAHRILDPHPVRWHVGGHDEALFARAEVVVVNPAVPRDSPWLACARRHGCQLTTEVNLALAEAREVPALALTGTHGKSTAASLAAWILERSGTGGRVVLAGNLGGSVLEAVEGLGPEDRLVLELSSFQTEALEAPAGWPRVAALTGLGLDHLDRHGTAAAYAEAKRRLLDFQDGEGAALLPGALAEDPAWRERVRGRLFLLEPELGRRPWPEGARGWGAGPEGLLEFGPDGPRLLARRERLPLREPYRLASLLVAAGGARLLGAPAESLEEALQGWPGLPHRMQPLPAPPGRPRVDNGVATHPEPTAAALEAARGPVVLVAGGKDKGLDLERLAAACRRRCRALHLFGEGGLRLREALGAGGPECRLHGHLEAAVLAALADQREGETLLFSPSFASYDAFRNFADRARVFGDLCRQAAGENPAPGGDSPPRVS